MALIIIRILAQVVKNAFVFDMAPFRPARFYCRATMAYIRQRLQVFYQ